MNCHGRLLELHCTGAGICFKGKGMHEATLSPHRQPMLYTLRPQLRVTDQSRDYPPKSSFRPEPRGLITRRNGGIPTVALPVPTSRLPRCLRRFREQSPRAPACAKSCQVLKSSKSLPMSDISGGQARVPLPYNRKYRQSQPRHAVIGAFLCGKKHAQISRKKNKGPSLSHFVRRLCATSTGGGG